MVPCIKVDMNCRKLNDTSFLVDKFCDVDLHMKTACQTLNKHFSYRIIIWAPFTLSLFYFKIQKRVSLLGWGLDSLKSVLKLLHKIQKGTDPKKKIGVRFNPEATAWEYSKKHSSNSSFAHPLLWEVVIEPF